jgi:hypothetical protein
MCANFLSEVPKGRDHLEYLGVAGSIILKWILDKYMGGCGLDSPGSGWGGGPETGACEQANEASVP